MSQFTEKSVTAIEEAELCRRMFAHPILARELSEKLGFTGAFRGMFEIPTRQLVPDAPGPGDIDLIACDPAHAQETHVFQVKRVKVSERTFANMAPTKLERCEHGVIQTNLLGGLGFHRTWLLVVVVTDGRERPALNFFCRGITFELMDVVVSHPLFNDLAPEAGLAFVFLDQPVDKDISLAGGFHIDVRRRPSNHQQPDWLTAAVRELFAQRTAPGGGGESGESSD